MNVYVSTCRASFTSLYDPRVSGVMLSSMRYKDMNV